MSLTRLLLPPEFKALADKKWRYVLETMAKSDWNPVAVSAEAGHEVRTV